MSRRRGAKRERYWKRSVDPWVDKLWCPNCGARYGRHGSGGKRACKLGPVDHCEGIVCTCEGLNHFVPSGDVLVWRRTPCPAAECKHCGWTGVLYSVDFDRSSGLARCPCSRDGRHVMGSIIDGRFIAGVYTGEQREFPGDLTVKATCKFCGITGELTGNPTRDMIWKHEDEEKGSKHGEQVGAQRQGEEEATEEGALLQDLSRIRQRH